MNNYLILFLSLIGGLVMGALFFCGLWFTVKKTVASKMPVLWVLGSFIIRTSITIIGFYYISSGSLNRLLICVVGFIVARLFIISYTGRIDEKKLQLKKEAQYET